MLEVLHLVSSCWNHSRRYLYLICNRSLSKNMLRVSTLIFLFFSWLLHMSILWSLNYWQHYTMLLSCSQVKRLSKFMHNINIMCLNPGHALDVFDNYPQLLMEMALRLPCQIHKHCDPAHFDARWRTLLCEYMMNPQTPLRWVFPSNVRRRRHVIYFFYESLLTCNN